MINRISNPIINNRMILFPKSTGFMRLFEISQWNLYQITVLPHVLHTYASLLGMQFIQHYKHISKCIAKFTATSEKCFQCFPVHLRKFLAIQQLHIQNTDCYTSARQTRVGLRKHSKKHGECFFAGYYYKEGKNDITQFYSM